MVVLFKTGAKETRTPDPYNAIVVLYQLSYSPGMRATIETALKKVNRFLAPSQERIHLDR